MSSFDDSGFWSKIGKFAKAMGSEVLEKAFILYYVYQDPETPTWAKVKIVAAIAYLISPLDVIPDAIPVLGFSDDLAVLAVAVVAVAAHTKDSHRFMAKAKVVSLLGV